LPASGGLGIFGRLREDWLRGLSYFLVKKSQSNDRYFCRGFFLNYLSLETFNDSIGAVFTKNMFKNFGSNLRKDFLTGLVVILPILVTFYLLIIFTNWADKILGVPISIIFFGGHRIPGLGLVISVIIVVIIGNLAPVVLFKRIYTWLENKFLFRIPLVKNIYSSAKQINDILFLQKYTGTFRRVCAVEYPRKGVYSIGFVTNIGVGEVQKKAGKKMFNVFVPTTPSPATGFIVVVPEDEVILLDLSFEEAIKLIVSGGVLSPPQGDSQKF
jgi:uncharacterized membrane protein